MGGDGEEINWPGDVTMHTEVTDGRLSFLQNIENQEQTMETDRDDIGAKELEGVLKNKKRPDCFDAIRVKTFEHRNLYSHWLMIEHLL